MKFLAITALLVTLATQSFAQTCGDICTEEFWGTATPQQIATVIEAVDVNARTEEGVTPLHFAAGYGTPESIIALLEAGAEVNARNEEGVTPLHLAALYGNPETIAALVEAGADGRAETNAGQTPWDLAQDNESIQGTTAYWALNDARFR